MKKFLLLCVICLGSSFAGKSQTIDTLCFPVPVVQKLLIAGKQKLSQDTLIGVLRSDISLLEQMKATLQDKDATNQQIILSYRGQVSNLEQQKVVLQKEVKKWKRKSRWTAIGGLVLTGLTGFLLLTK